MKRLMLVASLALMVDAAALAVTLDVEKLPKCSMPLCRSVGCSASTLCAKGTTVKTCADICHGG
ncbi:MAG TPA: hypothetical protein VKL61_02650 [Candidatus Polarisedimenticolia bacterium]|nr:hypothetical protein [Candidatus Polarisedimenticolia bacterium]